MSAARPRAAWAYSRWDGTQQVRPLDGAGTLDKIADDLLYHGDVEAALRRLLREGFADLDGERVLGLNELIERIRRRREELSHADLSGVGAEVARALEEVVASERRGIDETALAETAAARDPKAADAARQRAAQRHLGLDLLPEGLAERFAALDAHDFISDEAARRFAELREQLRRDLARLQLDRAAAALAGGTPEQRAHLRDGLALFNHLLGRHDTGKDLEADFAAFQERFGDLFPPADSLEELLERLARQMATASAFLASLDPDQRGELEALAAQLMADVDLAWQVDQLGERLRALWPGAGWDAGITPWPGPPLGLAQAGELFAALTELGELEQLLASASPGALAEVDPGRLGELLGLDAAASLEALAALAGRLEQAGLVARRGGRLVLSPRGVRRLGLRALDELYARLPRDRLGDHGATAPGAGHDPAGETKAYEHGDPFRLSVHETLNNAIARRARRGGGVPVRLEPEDFAIEQAEQVVAASTVVALDLSLSMPMRDNFLAAKKVAIALQALIGARFPRDYLGLVGFSATAREVAPFELPELSWDYAYGTNLQHALGLARRMLANRPGTRQVVLVTDGEPTAHVAEDGEVVFHYPPVPETLQATLREVVRCTRAQIRINAFVLDATPPLRAFVEAMTRRNGGRAFFATPETLGDYVLVDFVSGRRGGRYLHPDR